MARIFWLTYAVVIIGSLAFAFGCAAPFPAPAHVISPPVMICGYSSLNVTQCDVINEI